MKRYIIILVAALSILTSCRIEYGSNPDPKLANRLLWTKVKGNIGYTLDFARLGIYATAIDAEDKDMADYLKHKWFPTLDVNRVSQGILFSYRYNNTKYLVITNNEKLSEGGVWIVRELWGNNESGTSVSFVGNELNPSSFYITGRIPNLGSDTREFSGTVTYDLSVAQGVTTIVLDTAGVVYDNLYRLEYSTPLEDMPILERTGSIYSGVVDMTYTDKVTDQHRMLRVKVISSNVEYTPL